MSVTMIPISNTPQNHENLHNNNDSDLWNIIQEQRTVIQELQKALNEMTLERDGLLAKLKNSTNTATTCTPSTSTSSSFTEDTTAPPISTSIPIKANNNNNNNNNKKSPIPPPRSPYRSNNNITYTDTQKSLPITKKKHDTDPRHSSLPNLQQQDDGDGDGDGDKLINIQVNVKAIHSSSLVLSITNKRNGKELWKIEKSYTDLLSMDIALKDQNKLEYFFSNTALVEKRLVLIQDYFASIVRVLKDETAFTTFCTFICKHKIQKEEYLTKRGKYNVGGSKKYYFIMSGSELKYFSKNQDQLYVGIVPFTPETRIGKQASSASSSTTKKTQQGDDDVLFQHAFIILLEAAQPNNPAYKYILCAESDSKRDEWVKVLHSQQCNIAKKASSPPTRMKSTSSRKHTSSSTSSNNTNNKSSSTTIPKVRSQIIRSNSDTSLLHPLDNKPIINTLARNNTNSTTMYIPIKVRQKTYQRSSLDDQAILRYHEANIAMNKQQKSHDLLNKASADLLPSDLDINENIKKKKSDNRKTFWSRKFFSCAVDPATTSLPSNFINNNSSDNASAPPPIPYYSSNLELYNSTSTISTANTTTLFQVFGVPLEEAIRLSKISDNFELPAIVYRCIEYLEAKNAVHEEGIYRLSGSSVQISNLRHQFCEHGDVDILAQNDHQVDVHVVAGLLKMWLRELPVNVLTNELLNDFLSVIDIKDKQVRVKKLGQLVSILPIANYSLLRTLVAHLIHIVHNVEHNKMTLRNVSIVFAPTLSIPSGVFTLLMSEFEYIFWTKNDIAKKKSSKAVAIVSSTSVPPSNSKLIMSVHPTTIISPKPSTSADRFKEQYLKAEEERSNRNSLIYKNNVPMSIISLENVINKDYRHRRDLIFAQDDIEMNDYREEEEEYVKNSKLYCG